MLPVLPPPRAPLYRQIEAQLRGRIESGELQPGDRLPSINDLRQHFGGVNHLTVRQALKHLTADGLIRAEQGRGIFVHQQAVRRTGRVALVLPHLGPSFFLPIARGVQAMLSEAGIKTLILETRWDFNEETDTLAHLEELSIDGAILFPVLGSQLDKHKDRLRRIGFPVVLVDRSLEEAGLPTVEVDNYAGGYAIGRHLAARGHRQIAWLSEMVSSAARARLSGLRDGLADADIALPRARQMELALPGARSDAEFRAALATEVHGAVDALLARNRRPDAIACGNDRTALCVLDALARHDIGVPTEIAVTGFDDLADAASSSPPLTTVRQPLERLGHEAAVLLTTLIDQREVAQRSPLPVELVVRESG